LDESSFAARLDLRRIPVVGPTEAVIPQPATGISPAPAAVTSPPAAITRPPAVRKPPPVPSPDYRNGAVPAPARPSGWQLAQRVWEDSGISWDNAMTQSAADGQYSPDRDPYLANAYSAALTKAGWYSDDPADLGTTRYDLAAAPVAAAPVAAAPVAAAPVAESIRYASFTPREPARVTPAPAASAPRPQFSPYPDFAAPPLGAPVSYAEPATHQPPACEPGSYEQAAYAEPVTYGQSASYDQPRLWDNPAPAREAAPRPEPDELFRAWQGSVREATGRRPRWTARGPGRDGARGGRGRSAARIGVPAAVIVTVGAGALLLLTGRANEMLAVQSDPSAASPATPAFSAGLSPVSSLAGYPGQHGTVAVAALWSAGGLTLASGTADGHPALWRRAASGSWSLVSAAALGGVTGHLTSVTRGPLGWVAVGSVAAGGTAEPALYQSADGVTWTAVTSLTALSGSRAQFLGVTANASGYVVVGKAFSGPRNYAAMWTSADLKNWTVSGNSGNTGSFAAAVTSTGTGFAAVGSELNCHTIWTSPDGSHWTAHDLSKPDGAKSATLRSVAAGTSGHFAAAGYAVTSAGDIPLVVATTDGGRHLTQVVLSSPGGPATVTAVTATSNGYTAAGLAGSGSGQRAVTWTSKDGLTWSSATPLSAAGRSEITALAAAGSTAAGPALTGTAQNGPAATLLTIPAS
jgi:hypothetical protein